MSDYKGENADCAMEKQHFLNAPFCKLSRLYKDQISQYGGDTSQAKEEMFRESASIAPFNTAMIYCGHHFLFLPYNTSEPYNFFKRYLVWTIQHTSPTGTQIQDPTLYTGIRTFLHPQWYLQNYLSKRNFPHITFVGHEGGSLFKRLH